MGSKEGFCKVAEIIACLYAAGSGLVERKISDGGGKGDDCWKEDLMRQEGMDSVPRWAVSLAQEHRKQRAGGGGWTDRRVGRHGRSLLRVSLFSREIGSQATSRDRGSGA